MSGPLTALRNLFAGDYSPGERMRRVISNVGRRRPNRGCCGNYGDPGC
jgi:hypothetical protein